MDINFEIKGISEAEAIVNKKELTQSISRALNRAAKAGFTAGSMKIREEYNIKAKDIRKASRIKGATYGDLQAKITITGGPIPLKYFGARQTQKGVTVRIKKDEGRILIKHAFISGYAPVKVGKNRYRMKKVKDWGGGHVYIRKIPELRTPFRMAAESVTIPKLFESKKVWEVVEQRINESFRKEFKQNYEFYLSKKGWE